MVESLAFLAGSVWGMIILAIALCAIMVDAFNDDGVIATVAFIAALATLQFFYDVPVWATIRDQPLTAISYTAVYLLLGVAWAVFKWNNKLNKFVAINAPLVKAWKEAYEQFCTDNPNISFKLEEFIAASRAGGAKSPKIPALKIAWPDKAPQPTGHKATIISWIAWWPFSIIAYLIGDSLRELFDFIYAHISGVFTKMSERANAKAGW